jgi:integrase
VTVLRQTKTKKGKTRYWVDFVSDRRHQRKFQIFEDACEYLYLNWFCYKINNRSVNDDAVFDGATLKEMMHVYYGYQQHRYAHNEISYNTLNRYKSILTVDIDISMSTVTANMFVDAHRGLKVMLRTFFEWLKTYELILINPIKVQKYSYKLPYIATKSDIKNINKNNNLTEQDKLLIYIAQHTGARISEIVTLRVNNLTDKTISFVTHEVGGIEKLQTKSGVGRTIRVNPKIINKIKSLYIPNENTYVFWNPRLKKRITERAFRQRFKRKINFTSFHSLRHRVASEWIQGKVDLTRISKAMGHHSIAYTLQTYAHLIHANDEMPMVE